MQFSSGIGWHTADIENLPNGSDILIRIIAVSSDQAYYSDICMLTGRQWPNFCQALYFFQLGCVKASIVSLYLRLTVVPSHRRILWILLGIIFGQGLSSTIVCIVEFFQAMQLCYIMY